LVYVPGADESGGPLTDPIITDLAAKYGKTPAQVVLRWHIEHGNVVFPKSTTPARIRENVDLFDFQLEPADVIAIDALDRGEAGRRGAHPDTFAYIPD
jgi:2,5-diketo-D-gluconate reductase A